MFCGNPECGVSVSMCANREKYDICNVYATADQQGLCKHCRTTVEIPDLSVEGNLQHWQALESAKRRLLYDLDLIGTPWREDSWKVPLRFRFLADTETEHFSTGHADGLITINLEEANPVRREQARQEFSEPQRTLIGHLRHEVSHFLWQVLVEDQDEASFSALFGDHNQPEYAAAMASYYELGAPENWQERYISQYASSHPWEDFAETTAFYIDMRSVLDTISWHFESLGEFPEETPTLFDMLTEYQSAGLALNEINRSMGLTDLLPEVISPQVKEKLEYVHQLLSPVGVGVGE